MSLLQAIQSDTALRTHISDAVTRIGAEEGSLLLAGDSGLTFALCHSPHADTLEGKQLDHGRGIVGLSFGFQQPMAVNAVQHDPAHDPSIDRLTGTTTRSEAVVPVSLGEHEHGCLTAINSHRDTGFTPADLQALGQVAEQMAQRITELQSGGDACI